MKKPAVLLCALLTAGANAAELNQQGEVNPEEVVAAPGMKNEPENPFGEVEGDEDVMAYLEQEEAKTIVESEKLSKELATAEQKLAMATKLEKATTRLIADLEKK